MTIGPLTEPDIRAVVVEYLREYCKELDKQHVDTICRTPQARNPLYLLVMLNELRLFGENESLVAQTGLAKARGERRQGDGGT